MIKLNNYLYEGETIFKILKRYSDDLEENAMNTHNQIDLVHSNFLSGISYLLEHNEFLTSQSQRMREFYKYMVGEYPYLAFSFKGRIKSLIRAEEKFNRYIVDYSYDYYKKYQKFPSTGEIKKKVSCFWDLIAYRIVISIPKCHLKPGENIDEEEEKLIYEIANKMPYFLKDRGFSLVKVEFNGKNKNEMLNQDLLKYYKDYIANPSQNGYQSLHLTLFDEEARCYTEMQLRTKKMDDNAEIGRANHLGYETKQKQNESKRNDVPMEECGYYKEAYERVVSLENLDLSKIDVNMFSAVNNSLINDGCGLFRGRLILPFEHLSRFQNGIID